MPAKETATYKIVSEADGCRFMFFCDVTGAHGCTTKKVYSLESPEDALMAAWNNEGRHRFNHCHRCGKWVVDAAYNVEVLECIDCAPYECEPHFCKTCGTTIETPSAKCTACGSLLLYEGGRV